MASQNASPDAYRVSGALLVVRRVLALLGALELWLAVAALVAVVGLTIVQVVLRYGFETSIWWAQEVSQMLILVAYFQGISYAFKTRQDIVIDFFVQRLAPAVQLYCYLFAQFLIVVLCLVIVIESIILAPRQLLMKTYILHIPRVYLGLPLLLASLSMLVTSLYYSLAVWRGACAQPDKSLPEVERTLLISQAVGEL